MPTPPGPLAARLLNDPRDAPFLPLMAQCMGVAMLGVGLFFVDRWFWGFAVAYWAVWGLGVLDRFILMLHCTAHKAPFRKEYDWMNNIIPWVLCPFFGQTPNSYSVHHIGMHHIEENLAGDLSSTMRYRRDRPLAWLHYVGTFLTVGLPQLALYHWRRGTRKQFWRLLVGELSYWSVTLALLTVNPRATLVVFVIPVLAVRLLMMAGNWAQHAFIDPEAPEDPYRSSITCLGERYNRRCFNDGYHASHHVKAKMHFSEHPIRFQETLAEYGAHDAIVFRDYDFFEVWLLLMTQQHRRLAKSFVALPGAPTRTEDEVLALLHHRLQPCLATAPARARGARPGGTRAE